MSMQRDLLWPVAMGIAIVLTVAAGLSLRTTAAETHGAEKLPSLKEALRQDPASPYRWCDLADGFVENGQREPARYCFEQARRLAPAIPPIWVRAMFFDLQNEDTAAALDSSARVLQLVPDYDPVIFNYYDRFVPTVAEVLPHLAGNRRAGRLYFRHLLKSATVEDAALAWTWLRVHSFAQDQLATEYLEFLLSHQHSGEAATAWATYLGERRGDYPDRNLIFNGNFDTEPTGAVLDWRITNTPGVETNRDSRSLHLVFHGTGNVNYRHTSQSVCVRPGEYRFQASVRTKELTTDEGLRFHLFDPQSGARLDVRTGQLTGTHDWTPIQSSLHIPAGTSVIIVQLCRNPSWKFDNKISGEAWVRAMSLTEIR